MLRRKQQSWPLYIFRLILFAMLAFVMVSVFTVMLFKFANPPVTPLMIKFSSMKLEDGERFGIHKAWKDIEEISPNLVLAVVASEDNRFLEHNGFDMKAIREAREHNKKGKTVHGASTISMQTAKNVFLWPSRTWTRKGFELWFTVLIEVFWSKERIMEVYLNIIEVGKGIYGAEMAAQEHYNSSASGLSKNQAAMIAAILPNPKKRNPRNPTSYMYDRQKWILWNMRNIEKVELK